jgi:hypothetical protein
VHDNIIALHVNAAGDIWIGTDGAGQIASLPIFPGGKPEGLTGPGAKGRECQGQPAPNFLFQKNPAGFYFTGFFL